MVGDGDLWHVRELCAKRAVILQNVGHRYDYAMVGGGARGAHATYCLGGDPYREYRLRGAEAAGECVEREEVPPRDDDGGVTFD
eukprot:39030-Eustigmatos_ZCMA.PRE.1